MVGWKVGIYRALWIALNIGSRCNANLGPRCNFRGLTEPYNAPIK